MGSRKAQVALCLHTVSLPLSFSSCLLPLRLQLPRSEVCLGMCSGESLVVKMLPLLMLQVIPTILSSNGSLPMDQIGEALGIKKEPIASPFTKPVQFAANPKVAAALAAATTMNTTVITGAVADLGAHLVLQQIFYGNMFTDTPLLDG